MLNMFKKQIFEDREKWLNWEIERDQTYTFPENIEFIDSVPFGTQSWENFDVYIPDHIDAPLPVIIDVHGGGLVMGDKGLNKCLCADLASRGFLVFAVAYPLVPEYNTFDQLNAVSRALDAVGNAIPAYHGDPDRVFLVGDSAGAFLAMYTVAISASPAMADASGVTPCSLPVKALGMQSGMYYPNHIDKSGIFFLRGDFFGKKWRKHPFKPYLTPENPEVHKNLPPCFMSTAAGDYLRSYSVNFEKVLSRAGIRHEFIDRTEQLEHAFNALHPEYPESEETNTRMIEFFRNI